MKIPILDGYVEKVDFWGARCDEECEQAIIEAARMSTDGAFKGWDKDMRLLKYLYTHKHMSPFEMCGMTIEIMAPIFVFREWHRHRTQSYNEMSGRYTSIPDINYMPSYNRIYEGVQKAKSKQAKGITELATHDEIESWLEELADYYDYFEELYQRGLSLGIPKEVARIGMPVGRYSKMRASANLRNWLQFLTLRCAPDAQHEIRVYANVVADMLRENFPRTMELYDAS